ncbi:MAG: peptidyl-prolyl cis-trans isomerase [Synergistaceae bacterium]|jgi:hypothetical protein|nr:peptidyl-prolyl cis-trans isomerase [Synergistaceae bacterium]
MKFHSTPTNSPWERSSRRLPAAFFALVLVFLAFALGGEEFFISSLFSLERGAALAAQGTGGIEDEDAVTLLNLSLGGQDLAVTAWAAMNPSEKQALRDQAALIDSMARAAEREGFLASPDVERAVRWGKNAFLADAWEKKTRGEIDISDAAVRAFYEANLQRYAESGAVRYRRATYPSGQKKAAANVKKRLRKASLDSLKECVTVDWTEYDALPPALAGALRGAPLREVMGPVEVPGGHVLYEVLERREEGPAPFEQCKGRVKNDLVQIAIKEKLEKLEQLP